MQRRLKSDLTKIDLSDSLVAEDALLHLLFVHLLHNPVVEVGDVHVGPWHPLLPATHAGGDDAEDGVSGALRRVLLHKCLIRGQSPKLGM